MEAARESDNVTAARQFDNVTWAGFSIVGNELTVWNQDVKSLKYKDLRQVCSQLKVQGIKNATQEQTIKKLTFLHQVKTRYGKASEVLEASATRKEPSALLDFSTSYFPTDLLKAFLNLGM